MFNLGDTVKFCGNPYGDNRFFHGHDYGVVIDKQDDQYLVSFRTVDATDWMNEDEICLKKD